MNIQDRTLVVNKYSRPGIKIGKIKNIVIHYVGNPGSSASANRNYFNNLAKQSSDKKNPIYASSHYIVGLNGEVLSCVPEIEISYHGNSSNSYSIGIECCHPDSVGKFNTSTYDSLIELVAMLCDKYKLNPLTDVIRHYDITKKMCPIYYVKNISEWDKLKIDVRDKMVGSKELNDKEKLIEKMCIEYGMDKSWVARWNDNPTVYEIFAILDKVVK